MTTRLKIDDLALIGFRDIKLKSGGEAGYYDVTARINARVGKSNYWIKIITKSRKTISRLMSIHFACEAIIDAHNSFLELSPKEKLVYIEETGSTLYDGE